MLCKDKITSIFCIIDNILKEINHSEDIPSLVQACSLCQFKIQNSKFSPRPTRPTRLTCPSPPNPPNPPSLLNPLTSPTSPTIHNSPRTI